MTLMFGLCAVAALSVVPAPRTISVADGEVDARTARIVETRDASVAREGYRLTVSPEGVSVVAADDAGAFYARETLKQLEENGKYPCCTVDDAPAYRWRGVMIDEARHFLGKKAVKRLLDLMAMNKLNVLHWHLTDDQGWRLEIRRHPELVTYGAVRPRSVKYGSPTQWKDGKLHYDLDNDPYGPFYYTLEDVREILAYAKARQVTVVPEIELPGHERALLAAHPEFSCRGDLPRIPRLFWSIEEDVLCAGNDAAMKYLEDIFDEVCELFPDAPFIHIGGDECPRVRWEKCPKCQARIKSEGLKETSDLQSWMTARFVRFLERKGRRAVGWDEVLAGDVPKSTVGMTWRESAKAGAGTHYVSAPEAVRRGHDVVMTPNAKTYLSRLQGFVQDPYPYYSPKGPGIDLKCAYSFDPAAGIPAEGRSHILGGQASVWGEFVWNAADLEWKTWPRACAIAEALWTAPAKRNYADFRARMTRHRERLLAAGANCAPLDRDETFFNPLGRRVEIALGNPGFEEGRAGGWSFSRNHFIDEQAAHGGRRCARIEVADPQKDGVYLTRRVPVEPGRTYSADCFIRTEGVASAKGRMSSVGACLIVEWNDANGKWCAAGKYSKSLWGTNGWTRVCCDRVKAPANAGSATIFLTLRGKGTAWFDDVHFARIETGTDKLVPADGAVVACNTPKFTWRPRPMARRYRLELSRDASFKTARAYDVGGFTEWRLEEPLEPGDWFWRVSSDGDEDARPYAFTQTAPAARDCLPPLVLTKACRVTDGGQEVRVKVRDRGKTCPTVTLLGQKGVSDGPATDGVWTFRFAAPSGGWAKGLVETRVAATDAAGNAAETDFWLLNAPKPPNANRIGKDGFFHEDAGRIFPLGIYQVEPKDMAEVRACGFDAVHTYKWEGCQDDAGCRAYLDRCWEADGLRAFVGFDRGNGSKNGIVQGNFGSVARRVGALADHPGLFLWYLFDEPEIADYFVSPDLLTAFADLVRTLDPYHTVVMTTWGGTMNEYRRTWDTHWTQAYGNPREVIDLLAEHRTCLKNDSPITLLVNCNDHEQSRAWRVDKVPPDPSKFARDYDFLRACALLGVVKGCNGVWWWWFARGSKEYFSAASSPSAWANMRKVVAELRDLRPLVTADGEVKSGTVTVGKDKVEWWTKTVGGKSALIAVNTADHPVAAELDVPGFGKVTHTFARYEVKRLQQTAMRAVPLADVTVEGAVGAKMDRLLAERVYSSHAQGKVFDEAVNAFRTHWDDTHKKGSGGWQGEYWGKTMLGYTGACRYTGDPALRRFVEEKALALIREFQRPDGYLGTYADPYFIGAKPPKKPWTVWTCNLWNRKYTIWALTEAAEVTGNREILRGAERAMDHWIESLRHEKMSVRESGAFSGFMSMSILKPLLVLARDANSAKFEAFADELVSQWRLEGPIEETLPNLLVNAFNDRPVHTWAPNSKVWAKTYEMTSCLEGLVEYARRRGDARVLDAVKRLVAKLERDEMNPMWSVGHFDHFAHSAARQSGMTEPCDVVHWLRLNRELYLMTADKHYLDLMEKAFYNAFLAGTYRDGKWTSHIVRSHGTRHLSAPPQTGMLYHQCCVDNQPRGFYAFAEALCATDGGGTVRLAFLSDASVSVGDFKIQVRGNYPVSDTLTLFTNTVEPRPLKIRVPDTVRAISAGGKPLVATNGWVTLACAGEQVTILKLDMKVQVLDAPFDASADFSNRYECDLAAWTPRVFEQSYRTPEMAGLVRMQPAARLMRGPLVLAKCRAVGTTRAETLDFASIDRKGYTCSLEPIFCDRVWGAWKATFAKGDETFSVNVSDFQSAADYDDATNWFSLFF